MAIHHVQLGPCFTLPVAVRVTPGSGADGEPREVFPTWVKLKRPSRAWRTWRHHRSRHRWHGARR
jgi:hypothetical protein